MGCWGFFVGFFVVVAVVIWCFGVGYLFVFGGGFDSFVGFWVFGWVFVVFFLKKPADLLCRF